MIYDALLALPLFTGMSLSELRNIISKTKVDFGKSAKGKTIIKSGQRCGKLIFIISGQVMSTATAEGRLYSVGETLNAPMAIEPQAVFGRFQEYTRTVKAVTETSMMTIDKNEIFKLISHYLIIRINFVNIFATKLQKMDQALWRKPYAEDELELKISDFIRVHCATPVGEKQIHIKMQTLAEILNTKRIYISEALNAMQARGLVSLSRGKIEVPELKNLM